MKKCLLSIIVSASFIVLLSCAPSVSQIQEAIKKTQAVWTPVPSQTAIPTYTPPPTIAIEVTRIVLVTLTNTPTPLFTPTITPTPTNTGTPTLTPNATQTVQARMKAQQVADKGDGFYLVGVDIAPGIWRSTGKGDNCYWATTTKTGDIVTNHFGMSGGTAFIPATAFQVEFSRCGTWVFVSAP